MKLRLFLICAALILLTTHVAATAIWLMPNSLIRKSLVSAVEDYINSPVFRQDWHLFSPNPSIEKTRFWMQCYSEQDKTEFFDPEYNQRSHHQDHIYSGVYKNLYINRHIKTSVLKQVAHKIQSCLDHEGNNVCSTSEITNNLKDSPVVEPMKRLVQKTCQERLKSSTSAQLYLVEYMPKKYSERNKNEVDGSMKNFPFKFNWGTYE